ncbi:phosphatidate cytidylyltransferase [Inhella gelatinilytica]|uniref:Phosphatidate cytidylyltransferase n=1 Tax=Inhella gelatinilytica TaxID=2795030 RepID=A0A931NBB6_9BURK|nr:phosphatidate cytidylyltransferase [Inhella gelatinilytica]MBH9553398.1 phosphatidate cytidylyltransferase [Inhella gelatinilytica]
MLKQRVLTAVVLLALVLPALASSQTWPFAVVAVTAMVLAGWEWGRLNGWGFSASVALGVAVLSLLAALHWWPLSVAIWQLVLLMWVLGGSWLLSRGPEGWAQWPQGLRLAVGPLLLVPAGLALVHLKGLGLNALLSVLCLVWMADIAAYAGGRLFGKRKLAPTISPGKSWEGVVSGLIGVLALAWFWVAVIDTQSWVDGASAYGRWVARWGWLLTMVICVTLSALSVMGDLVESLVKRAAGAKDSSHLLPGHGGVLDRIDALLPVLPAAWALMVLA